MASVERTAYPRFPRTITLKDLQTSFTPTAEELQWAMGFARSADRRLALLVQLKCFQHLHHFVAVDAIPAEIVRHVCGCLSMPAQDAITYPDAHRSLYRHHDVVRKLLGVRPFTGAAAKKETNQIALEASQIVDTRTDVINILVDELIQRGYELPSFSALVLVAEQVHEAAQQTLHERVGQRLSQEQREWLDRLVESDLAARQTLYNRIKRSAKKASRKHLELLLGQLDWLESLPDCDALLEGIPETKLRHMADNAAVLDAGELKDYRPAKRHALVLALIRRMRVRCRDDIAEMFIKRMSLIHKHAREALEKTKSLQREMSEKLVATLSDVLEILSQNLDDAATGKRVRELLAPHGDLNGLREDCAAIRVWSGSNHLPLVWKQFSSHRAAIFRMAKALTFEPATPDRKLLDALEVVIANEGKKSEWIADVVDLSFASERWRKLVQRSQGLGHPTNRRMLEVCVFSHLSADLKSGEICIEGSESFSNYRLKLLPWEECERELPAYCERIGIPQTADGLVEALKALLSDTASEVDASFPELREDVAIGSQGEPILKRVAAKEVPPSALALQSAIETRVPHRNLLDVLANIEHWTGFTRHFGPQSGNDAKLRNARERQLLTVFAMGCNLGPNQASRHLSNGVTPHQLSFVHRRHMSLDQLDQACRDLAELYLRLELPKLWGDGKKVAADGTQYDFYEQNLLVGLHFRYRRMGAVAYRHVADNYIAVFRHFIPPGFHEAVYVIEGLLKAGLSTQADTVYSDTHGQSETVFAFTHLVGIQLMPRIRNWKDLKFYRPDKSTQFKHIDRLFTDTINWEVIRENWQELMQAAISIKAGRIASPTLLRKLSNEGRHNRLFAAARELGRVLRTAYLLKWISSKEMRQEITGTTNKIESYHAFTKWLDFGGDVIAENDPTEQQKRLRYIDLVASAVILQNTVDMMKVVQDLYYKGEQVDVGDLAYLSPYMTSTIKRFGNYHLDLKRPPEPWVKETMFREAAKQSRQARDAAPDAAANDAKPHE